MTAVWRSTVPCDQLFGSLGGQPQDNVNRFQPTMGRDITHRLGTQACELMSFVIPLTYNQFMEFKDMYTNDFGDGSLVFKAKSPIDGTSKFFTFSEVYSWSKITPDSYHVGLSLMEGPEQ